MGIRFHCPGCRRGLNVKSYLAGKRGICPNCKTRFTIPEESSTSDSSDVNSTASDRPRVVSTANASGANGSSGPHKATTNASNPANASSSANNSSSASGSSNLQAVPQSGPHSSPKAFEAVDSLFESALSQFAVPKAIQPDASSQAPTNQTRSGPAVPRPQQVPAPVANTPAPRPQVPASTLSSNSQLANSKSESHKRSRVSKSELELNSRRPAPDWDDEHNQEQTAIESAPANTAAAPTNHRNPVSTATEELSNVKAGGIDEKPDTSRPFEDLPFEDLDPASFVLDRPERDMADKPTGYFDWIADSPQSVWYVRHRNGAQYGPAIGKQMRTWVDEGRVTDGCHVWREGWAHWRAAVDVFPQIRQVHQQVAAGLTATASNAGVMQRPASFDSSPAAEHIRSKNRWLFPAMLLFLAVVATIIGVGIYQFVATDENPNPDKSNGGSGKIVDPFADKGS